ncbi:MAG: DUF1800 domain-containing protein [Gemmatimonadetes bacterium]|nr:DUF1800 domain-containing protein [Gemmatimonadota bacterium]
MSDTPNRRSALVAGAAAVAALVAPRAASAQGAPPRPQRKSSRSAAELERLFTKTPAAGPQLAAADTVLGTDNWTSSALRLARRVTFGLNPAETQRAQRLGYKGYLEYHLNHAALDNSAVESVVSANWPRVLQPAAQLVQVDQNLLYQHLTDATLYRQATSPRQLFERMVEFWNDHFTIYFQKVGYLQIADNRDVIRQNALGNFGTLLKASAHSPAMLAYLDNNVNRAGRANENYAREIMELHSLGVDGGYTQTDVAELARCLTGWTLNAQGAFVFNASLHDFAAKTVLGVSIPARATNSGLGQQDMEQMLDVLIAHPNTATFIATKLLKFFLRPDPSAAQVAAVANAYTRTGGDIKAMLRVVFTESWMTAAPAKFKRPHHLMISALRASGAVIAPTATTLSTLRGYLTQMGQVPFDYETPEGYSDRVEYWSGNVLPRWNVMTAISSATTGQFAVSDANFTRFGSTAAAVADSIDLLAFGGEMNTRTRDALMSYLSAGTINATRIRETLALALSSSAFNWY